MIKIIQGNCLEIMKTFENQSIDVVFTSPPYNARLRVKGDKYIKRSQSSLINKKYNSFTDDLTIQEYQTFLDVFFQQCLRISKISFINLQFLSGNKRAIFNLIGKYSNHIKEFFIWDKIHTQPAMQNKVVNSNYEFFLILSSDINDAMKRQFQIANFEKGMFSNVFKVKPDRTKKNQHFATMPLSLVELILKNFAVPGQVICDPFLGTGTTGIICKKLSLNFIGIELNQQYCDFAKTRIQEPVQTNIF